MFKLAKLAAAVVAATLSLIPAAALAQGLSLTKWAEHGIEAGQISFHQDGTMILLALGLAGGTAWHLKGRRGLAA